MILEPTMWFAGFAFGFFIGSLSALINIIKAWFAKTVLR